LPESIQNNNVLQKPLVVFALLDWGLGHTTRTIPIIKHLMTLNYNILVACNSNQKAILEKELSDISYKMLDGYNLSYASSAWQTMLYIIFQIPKILIQINQEKRWLRGLLLENKVDLIVSDNRFGFFSASIPSIFITHQLNIRSGLGEMADQLLRFFNYRFINRFSFCWVPDYAEADNLAGTLSHPQRLPKVPVKWLGALSRLQACADKVSSDVDILIILSGPEPQRTLLEKKLLADAALIDRRFVVVRGLPKETDLPEQPRHIRMFNHLPAAELNRFLCAASFVISRSGYTSIMDYMKLGVKAVLIPTPGQAEQIYLATHLHQSQLALSIQQSEFSLANALERAASFPYKKRTWNMELYKSIINEWIENSPLSHKDTKTTK